MPAAPRPSDDARRPARSPAARRGARTVPAPLRTSRFATGAALTGTLVLGAVAGCASGPGASADVPASAASAPPAASATATADAAISAFPLTVDNCGVEVTFDAPPQRVVTIKSSATEMLLALGVGDRIVGTGFPDGPVPPEYAQAAAGLPVLSEKVPAAEVVLEAQPDLVYAGWESNLAADGAGDRATLGELGVATYVSPSACKDPAYQPDRLTFDLVFDEIREVAALLGVPDAAEDLVAEQRTAVDGVIPDARGLSALWYSSGKDVPYVGAGIGAPQMMLDALGLTNIAGGVADTWTAFSWEQVAADDPDVIVLVDASWNTAEAKKELLASSPATANLTAVLNERYLVVPFAATEAGVRNVPATVDLAAQLAALELG